MVENKKNTGIKEIDNSRKWMPFWTTSLLIFIIILLVWFFKGGSFRLYASLFFFVYSITQQVWISVILMGILQNILFLPLRMIGNHFNSSLNDFEEELGKMKEDQQYLVFNKKVKEGDTSLVFYIFNFLLNAVCFCSAGRIFLIDFYSDPLKLEHMNLLYKFIPYPNYPLQGVDFRLPLFKITQTMALNWPTIFMVIGAFFLFFLVLQLLWKFFRLFLSHNKQILSARIKYNRLLFTISGFGGLALILIVIFLRHIPTAFEGFVFIANLSHQNTPMNFTTAVGTFLVTIHAGYKNNSEVAKKAERHQIPREVIEKVFKDKMRESFKNALILGAGAFFVTNNIPSAFELSVTTFEIMYMIYPYTFGLLIKKNDQLATVEPSAIPLEKIS